MVESLDDAVGRLLDTLDRLELTEKTIIVFFSDNGGNMYSQVDGITVTSNAPLRGGKATIYDGGSRVPCAVVWPGRIKPGSTSDAFLTSTDWYPTLLEMMRIKKPEGVKLDGFNQVPALLGKAGPRTSICCFVPSYFSRPGTIPSTYLRRGDWKLIRFHGDGEKGADRFELYNLKKDIGETKNLAAIKPQLVKELNAEMDAYLLETEAIVPAANPAYDPDARPAPVRKPIDPEALFKRRDVNKDGFMTLKEYIGNPVGRNLPALTKQFNKRDANKDGKLTLAEMKGQ
jgi:arylsulfatase A-like enzyme